MKGWWWLVWVVGGLKGWWVVCWFGQFNEEGMVMGDRLVMGLVEIQQTERSQTRDERSHKVKGVGNHKTDSQHQRTPFCHTSHMGVF